jgi:Ran GTPase-activating protein (RanGAP) involved in mRNA processing and transport
VDHVVSTFPFERETLEPVLQYLTDNKPATDQVFPVGTITADGRLDMCKQQLGVEGIQLVGAALAHNTVIKHLLLGTNAFGNQGAAAVGALVAQNKTIETLYLGCNYIEHNGCKVICEALEENQSIKSLWFKRNPIGPHESMQALVQLLSKNSNIRTLDLVNTCAGEDFRTLLTYLEQNTTIERLYLSGNYLTSDMMKPVGEMLDKNKHLQSIFLSVNNIGDEGMMNLADGLANNTSIQEIGLASCGIEEEGAQLLFEILAANTQIKTVDMGYAPSTKALGAKANYLSEDTTAKLKNYKNLKSHPDSKAIKSVYR